MLLRVSRLSCRRAPAVAHARSLGFFADLKKKVGEEFSKNEALQKSLEELRQHDAVKGAGEAARSAAEAIKQAKAKAADLASEAKSKAAEIKQSVAEKEEVKDAFKWANEAREKASEAARSASASASPGAAGAEAKGSAEGQKQQEQQPGGAQGSGLFAWLGSILGDKPPPTSASGQRAPGEDNTDETAVVIKPPSIWEQAYSKAQDSPLLGGILGAFRGVFSGVGNVGSSVSDRVFGENENAEALALLLERDAAFRHGPFMQHIEAVVIPRLVKAYLAGHMDELKKVCGQEAFENLSGRVRARMNQALFMDRRILDLTNVELVGFRIVQEEPTAIVQFQTQQVNCVRDAKGRIVEGAEDDIRAVFYIMALQQQLPPPEPGADITAEQIDTRPSVERWVVTQVAFRGELETW